MKEKLNALKVIIMGKVHAQREESKHLCNSVAVLLKIIEEGKYNKECLGCIRRDEMIVKAGMHRHRGEFGKRDW